MIPTVACVAVVTCFCRQHHHITINHIMGWTGSEEEKTKPSGSCSDLAGCIYLGSWGLFEVLRLSYLDHLDVFLGLFIFWIVYVYTTLVPSVATHIT